MGEREAQQEEARAAHVAERAAVDAAMAAIDAEDAEHAALKQRKAAETRHFIDAFVADREQRRAAERAAEWGEEQKIQVQVVWFPQVGGGMIRVSRSTMRSTAHQSAAHCL